MDPITIGVMAALKLAMEGFEIWKQYQENTLTLEAAMLRLKAAQDRYAANRAAWDAAGHDGDEHEVASTSPFED